MYEKTLGYPYLSIYWTKKGTFPILDEILFPILEQLFAVACIYKDILVELVMDPSSRCPNCVYAAGHPE